jgi:hypothetical protein
MADFSWLYRGTAPHKPCPACGYLTWAGQGRREAGRCRGCVEDDDVRDPLGTAYRRLLGLLRGAA